MDNSQSNQQNLEVYIKPTKKYIANSEKVTLNHICEVFIPNEKPEHKKIREIILLKKIPDTRFTTISSLDIIRAIKKLYPNATIDNLGEIVTLISQKEQYEPKFKKYIKVAIISNILFAGCASAIITFHIDTQVNRLFNTFAHMINIDDSVRSVWLYMEIPYAIGIAAGILIFFNHMFGKSITNDPTPIEVEMSVYEADVVDALIDNSPAEQ